MNPLSEFIIRKLSPKPAQGQILVLPYLTVDQRGKTKPRKVSSPDLGAVASTSTAPLPGQIKLDDALPEMTERSYPVQSDNSNGNLQCVLTTDLEDRPEMLDM